MAAAALPTRAEQIDQARQAISAVAQALTSGDPAQAIAVFSKEYAQYDTLSAYFSALTNAYTVDSQIDFLDEDIQDQAVSVHLRWGLTLTTRQTAFTVNRTAELDLKAVKAGKQWKISEFAPISIFDPQGA